MSIVVPGSLRDDPKDRGMVLPGFPIQKTVEPDMSSVKALGEALARNLERRVYEALLGVGDGGKEQQA